MFLCRYNREDNQKSKLLSSIMPLEAATMKQERKKRCSRKLSKHETSLFFVCSTLMMKLFAFLFNNAIIVKWKFFALIFPLRED